MYIVQTVHTGLMLDVHCADCTYRTNVRCTLCRDCTIVQTVHCDYNGTNVDVH